MIIYDQHNKSWDINKNVKIYIYISSTTGLSKLERQSKTAPMNVS